ncbi:MAG: hypothetical protein CL596_05370 [Alteromonas sp.]|nr:hypothetical protein [Alteromonas sp.]|tara:strand:+ start:4959 stop:5516 length:558 start_codon:yes stop_codon:yes gene_type:complete
MANKKFYNPKINIQKFGDWYITKNLLIQLEPAIKKGSIAGQKRAAQELKRIVRRNIRENGGKIGWPPVSEKYAKYKRKKGFDPENLYVMTGLYYRSIKIYRDGNNISIGLKRYTRHQGRTNNNLTLIKIANILENGSAVRNIKARPLWKPSYKQFGGSKRLKGFILWHVRNEIKKRTGVTPKLTY